MEKDLRCSHNPIDLGWSDGCVADPHCGISPPKADGEPLEEVGSGVSRGDAQPLAQQSSKALYGVGCLVAPTSNRFHH